MTLDDLITSSGKPPQHPSPTRPPEPEPSAPPSWIQVWIKAVTKPSVETFEGFLRDPRASLARAYIWVTIAAVIGSALITVPSALFLAIEGTRGAGSLAETVAAPIFILSCGFPLIAFWLMLSFTVNIGVMHLVARTFGGGTGAFAQVAYLAAAYFTPLTLVVSLANGLDILIPFSEPLRLCLLPIINWAWAIYQLHLALTTLRAAHKLGPASALATALVAGIVAFIVLVAPLVILRQVIAG